MASKLHSMRFLPVLMVVALLPFWRTSTAQPLPANARFPGGQVRPGVSAQYRVPARDRNDPAWQEYQAEQLYRTGRAYIEQGFYGEGLEALNQSLALRPQYARALTYKGIALRAMREPQLALQQFNEAISIEPGDGAAYGERGLVYIILGDDQRADEDFEKAKQLRPDLSSWFGKQKEWMAANRPAVPQNSGQTQPTPEGGDEGVPSSTDPGSGSADAPGKSLFPLKWTGSEALVKPAMSVIFGFLLMLLLVRLALYFMGRILRGLMGPLRLRRPRQPGFQSPWTTRHRDEVFRQDLPSLSPDAKSPRSANISEPRPTFWRRIRGFTITAGIGLGVMALFAVPVLVQAFRLDEHKLVAPRERPTVLDFRGNVYTHLGVSDNPVTFADLPLHLVDALRAREDSRFFEHHGVDWIGLARALITDIRHMRIKQGASTLTMQLVEKVYDLDQKGLVNRLQSKLVEWTMAHRGEAALAREMGDKRAAKEAIMTAYLNRVEFGDGVVGVGAASLYYFNKPVTDLTLGESCMLVALLRAPTANSPYRNPENSRLARDKIVAQMLRRGYISDEQAKQARFLVVDKPERPRAKHNGYLVAAITREMNSLKSQGKLPADVWDHPSLSIESTLDLWAQDILDSEIRKVVSSFKGDTEADPLGGAGILIDNATGQIRALVSGQDYAKNQYDLALSSRRQVASIAKPFVYGAYLEQGGDISATVSNRALTAEEVKALGNWNPKNASSLKDGTYPLASGLAFSDNNMTVRVGLAAGLPRVYQTLYSSGLISDKATTGPTWLLGTFESSLANVVSAYTAFPRGGSRVTPYLVRSVKIDGKEVYRASPKSTALFSKRTCDQLHRALRETMTEGTGRTALNNAGLQASVAGKTGTSQNAGDVWWVGYVKDVSLGVRFGRDSNASLGSTGGGAMAAPVATRALKKLSERYKLNEANP